MKNLFIVFSLFFAATFSLNAQNNYLAYISSYKGLAIDQMNRYGIPASITLAQGLLESGAGRSELSTKANNHFGIKCGGTWNGPYMLKDDDKANEKFRVYNSPKESYEDHSKFLTTRDRYAFLFKIPTTDYSSWAHGLKQAGYATNPKYAYNLISIIEKYNLDQFDCNTFGKTHRGHLNKLGWTIKPIQVKAPDICDLVVRKNNGNYYVIVRSGDTFQSISKETGVSVRKLRKYNEVDKRYNVKVGDIVYLEKKRTRADKQLRTKIHIINSGESLYTIAQSYGIQLKSLYKKNKLTENYVASVGQKLYIR